jgi:hypothetical protein
MESRMLSIEAWHAIALYILLQLIEDNGSSSQVPLCCDFDTSILSNSFHVLPSDSLRSHLLSPL